MRYGITYFLWIEGVLALSARAGKLQEYWDFFELIKGMYPASWALGCRERRPAPARGGPDRPLRVQALIANMTRPAHSAVARIVQVEGAD